MRLFGAASGASWGSLGRFRAVASTTRIDFRASCEVSSAANGPRRDVKAVLECQNGGLNSGETSAGRTWRLCLGANRDMMILNYPPMNLNVFWNFAH